MNNNLIIAIDGPAGAGKSTVARQVARQLKYLYIDTGAMYRALTFAAIRDGVDVGNEEKLKGLLDKLDIKLDQGKEGLVYVNEEEVSNQIRTTEVSSQVSTVASYEEVRIEMVKRQRLLAKSGGVVLDGRDIGTYVLPDADVKVYLTASVEERAKRRFEEQSAKGIPSDFVQIKQGIARRDELDSTREFAPLVKADDATTIDSTNLSIQQVVNEIIKLVKERLN